MFTLTKLQVHADLRFYLTFNPKLDWPHIEQASVSLRRRVNGWMSAEACACVCLTFARLFLPLVSRTLTLAWRPLARLMC